MTDSVAAGLRQLDLELGAFRGKEVVRDLDQDAGAVTRQRIGTHGAAVLQVLEDVEGVLDNRVRLAAFQVGDETDAARVVLAARVEQAARFRTYEPLLGHEHRVLRGHRPLQNLSGRPGAANGAPCHSRGSCSTRLFSVGGRARS
jgi:hypothetical protein